jgi:hypothetical protein
MHAHAFFCMSTSISTRVHTFTKVLLGWRHSWRTLEKLFMCPLLLVSSNIVGE